MYFVPECTSFPTAISRSLPDLGLCSHRLPSRRTASRSRPDCFPSRRPPSCFHSFPTSARNICSHPGMFPSHLPWAAYFPHHMPYEFSNQLFQPGLFNFGCETAAAAVVHHTICRDVELIVCPLICLNFVHFRPPPPVCEFFL